MKWTDKCIIEDTIGANFSNSCVTSFVQLIHCLVRVSQREDLHLLANIQTTEKRIKVSFGGFRE